MEPVSVSGSKAVLVLQTYVGGPDQVDGAAVPGVLLAVLPLQLLLDARCCQLYQTEAQTTQAPSAQTQPSLFF